MPPRFIQFAGIADGEKKATTSDNATISDEVVGDVNKERTYLSRRFRRCATTFSENLFSEKLEGRTGRCVTLDEGSTFRIAASSAANSEKRWQTS